MRVARIVLDGVGPFEQAEFEFPKPQPGQQGELFLFEGPNGCGKTTIVVSIAMVLGPSMDAAKGGYWDHTYDFAPFYWGRRIRRDDGISTVLIEHNNDVVISKQTRKTTSMTFPGSPLNFEHLGHYHKARQGEHQTVSWAAYAFSSHQKTPRLRTAGPAKIKLSPFKNALRFGYEYEGSETGPPLGQTLVNMDYERVRALASLNDSSRQKDFTNLKATARSYAAAIKRMQDAFSQILDCEVEFRFEVGDPEPKILFDGEAIPIDLLGEGMRSTIAWLADFMIKIEITPWENRDISPFDQHFWLILDEIDQSLHPKMQMRILHIIRKLFPNACIYATTHSPFVVGSIGQGYVFSINPQHQKMRRVEGKQEALPLKPGQSLKWVVSKIFETSSAFLDEKTIIALEAHRRNVDDLLADKPIQWESFLKNRMWLQSLNDEVRTVVAMRELQVESVINAHLDQVNL